MDGIVCLVIGLELDRYIYTFHGNWDNYKSEDEFAAGDEEDKKLEDMKESLDNQYALYGMYD